MTLGTVGRSPLVWCGVFLGLSATAAWATRDVRYRNQAVEALRGGDAPAAVDLLERIAVPDASVALVLGTALVEAGRADQARGALAEAVARSGDPEVRRRALVNLSVANLRLAARAAGGGEVHARAAAVAAADALRLRPGDADARWNLALALRLLSNGAPRGTPLSRDDGGVRLDMTGANDGGGGKPLAPEEARRILDALRSEEGTSVARGAADLVSRSVPSSQRRGPPW